MNNAVLLAAESGGIVVPVGLFVSVVGIALMGLVSLCAYLTKQMLELSRQNAVLTTRLEAITAHSEKLGEQVMALAQQVRQLEIYGMQWKQRGDD